MNIVRDGEENYDLDVNYDEYVGRKWNEDIILFIYYSVTKNTFIAIDKLSREFSNLLLLILKLSFVLFLVNKSIYTPTA